MKATKILPVNYTQQKTLDLSRKAPMILMNIAAIPMVFIFGGLFYLHARSVRPEIRQIDDPFTVLTAIGAFVIIILLHELIHGLFFWVFTNERPKFAFKGAYAYAAAPEWYVPRNQFIVVGLSPLILISMLGVVLFWFLPTNILPPLIFSLAMNAAGALGDVIVIIWILTHPANVFVLDTGDTFNVFTPQATP